MIHYKISIFIYYIFILYIISLPYIEMYIRLSVVTLFDVLNITHYLGSLK